MTSPSDISSHNVETTGARQMTVALLDASRASGALSGWGACCTCSPMFDYSSLWAESALRGKIDAEASRSWNARLPRDEATPLTHSHHLVYTWRGDKEVPLNVRLGRRSAKALDVLGDEGEVFEFALHRALCFALRCA